MRPTWLSYAAAQSILNFVGGRENLLISSFSVKSCPMSVFNFLFGGEWSGQERQEKKKCGNRSTAAFPLEWQNTLCLSAISYIALSSPILGLHYCKHLTQIKVR